MDDGYVLQLNKISSLFARALNSGKQYLCLCEHLSDEHHLQLLCTDCDKVWDVELSYSDLLHHKDNLGLNKASWGLYFSQLADAFLNDSIAVEVEQTKGVYSPFVVLIALCSDNLNQLTFKYNLAPCTKPERKKIEKLTNCVFELFNKVQRQSEAEKELKQLKRELCSKDDIDVLPTSSPFTTSNDKSSTNIAPIANSTKTGKGAAKRKPGYSLVNPRVKRHIPKGAKIVE